VESAMTF